MQTGIGHRNLYVSFSMALLFWIQPSIVSYEGNGFLLDGYITFIVRQKEGLGVYIALSRSPCSSIYRWLYLKERCRNQNHQKGVETKIITYTWLPSSVQMVTGQGIRTYSSMQMAVQLYIDLILHSYLIQSCQGFYTFQFLLRKYLMAIYNIIHIGRYQDVGCSNLACSHLHTGRVRNLYNSILMAVLLYINGFRRKELSIQSCQGFDTFPKNHSYRI